jgi:uncharacterized OB-fold protein
MTDAPRRRVPVKPGYFTVPDDPHEPPRLLASKCNACGEHYFPRRAICARAACLSDDVSDVEIGPRGTLFSYTFVHMPLFGSSNLEHMDGYGVGQVDLPEGPRVQLPLAGKKDDFRIGQTLEAELDKMREDGDSDVVIVRFRPVESSR